MGAILNRLRPGNGRLLEAAEFVVELGKQIRARRQAAGLPPDSDGPDDVAVAAEVLAENPAAKSRLDGEKWYENRLITGPLTTLLGILIHAFGWDIQISEGVIIAWGPVIEALGLIATFVGGAFAKWLKPINWRRPWTILGFK